MRFAVAINSRVHPCQNVLIVAEEHTRNTWYLENVKVLKEVVEAAGFKTVVATFLDKNEFDCDAKGTIELETATGAILQMHCIHYVVNALSTGALSADMIILNNDLSSGVPDALFSLDIPIYPSVHAGWHSRRKSQHFELANTMMNSLCSKFFDSNVDPWLMTTLFRSVDDVDINLPENRERLMDTASDLFKEIENKFHEHRIQEKPFVFLKANTGTYGMGVMAIEDPSDILALNRKGRNKLHKGKSAVVNTSFILQEGVPTGQQYDRGTSEVVLYHVSNAPVGGFLRVHGEKGARDNLNSKGMKFVPFCMADQRSEFPNLPLYEILGQVAGLAASQEIQHLEDLIPKPELTL